MHANPPADRPTRVALFLRFRQDMPEGQPAGASERSLLIDDAAEMLGVSRRTIYYRIREGRLQTIRARCGSQRVLMSSIEVLLRAGREADARRRCAGGS